MRLKWAMVIAVVCAAAAVAYGAGKTDAPALTPPAASEWEYVYSTTGMEGLTEVGVSVEDMKPEFCRFISLSKQDIRTQTELYLRRVPGLRVTDDPLTPDSYGPRVYVRITGMVRQSVSGTDLGYAANVELQLHQPALVPRHPKAVWLKAATTWETGYILSGGGPGGADHVRGALRQRLDNFQNEYLKANPDVKA